MGHRVEDRRFRRCLPGIRESARPSLSLANPNANLEVTAESRFEERTLGAHNGTVRLELAALASNGHVGIISTREEAMH